MNDTFNLGKVLGKGQFGTTRIAIGKESGEKYACKTISKRKLVKKQVCNSGCLGYNDGSFVFHSPPPLVSACAPFSHEPCSHTLHD